MIAHIRNGYIVDDRPDPIEIDPMMFYDLIVTDEDYYPLPHERGEVVQLEDKDE